MTYQSVKSSILPFNNKSGNPKGEKALGVIDSTASNTGRLAEMSQHIFRTERDGRTVEVLMGYYLPLQYYFMNITDDNGVVIHSALNKGDGMLKNLDRFIVTLSDLGFELPVEMLVEVEEDAAAQRAKKVVCHFIVNSQYIRTPITECLH